jgi:hypothetical protein
LQEIYGESKEQSYLVSAEVGDFLSDVADVVSSNIKIANQGFDETTRRAFVDGVGEAGSHFRSRVYHGFLDHKVEVHKALLLQFFDDTLHLIDQSIEANKRADNLFHAYNLVSFSAGKVKIRNLYEMLEGQVSVLSSGKLTTKEAIDLLDSLRNSALYRPDQNSYILYPNKRLPLFLEKNVVPQDALKRIPLLEKLVADGERTILSKDQKGLCHFNADFNNASFLRQALLTLKANGKYEISESDIQAVEHIYEEIFDHQSFTGRSGTFYKYEGLGCIYWHMVSKLLLAIGESIHKAHQENAPKELINQLKRHYHAVKSGIGAHKSPAEYGSFPFDPYSHTPMMAGVQQPGMTGQVKEDIISRFNELGVAVENGRIQILTELLDKKEFIAAHDGVRHLSFTYCNTPFVYLIDGRKGIDLVNVNGDTIAMDRYWLDEQSSSAIFNRTNEIKKVVVHFE